VDIVAKCTGAARYGYDVTVPGMVFAAIVHSPTFGGAVKSCNARPALAVPGVLQVLSFGSWVACVAEDTWSALQGAGALEIEWDGGPAAALDDAAIEKATSEAMKTAIVAKAQGNFGSVTADGAKTLTADYSVPYLDHACMEPTSAVASVLPNRIEIWSGTQAPKLIHLAAKLMFNVPEERIFVHQQLIGSSFGRRGVVDAEIQAMSLSKRLGKPVKVIRSRAEDIQHGFYRPMQKSRIEGVVAGGRVTGLRHVMASQSLLDNYARYFNLGDVSAQRLAQATGPKGASGFNFAPFDLLSVNGSSFDFAYEVPNAEVHSAKVDLPIPTGLWRGVGEVGNVFAVESFLDEAAHAAQIDPADMRQSMLEKQPRFLQGLKVALDRSDWAAKPPAGVGRGLAICNLSDSVTILVAEVSVKDGVLSLRRFLCVVDNGIVINPDVLEAQVQGGLLVGLSAALWGKISFDGGRVQQNNFNDYQVMTLRNCPQVEVVQLPGADGPFTISESICPVVAPALCNAIFAASGMRLRDLPIIREGLALA